MNAPNPNPSAPTNFYQRLRIWLENVIMARLVPLDRPGPVFRWLFKAPVVMYRLGLGHFIGQNFLLLTTIGRKSGQPRFTPLEYWYDAATDTYMVMAGWGGRTDWYRNARANPQVQVQIGTRRITATAEPVPDDIVAQKMIEVTRLNPKTLAVWSRWAGKPLDGSDTSLREAAPFFPMLWLKPQ